MDRVFCMSSPDESPHNLSPLVLKYHDSHITAIRCSLERSKCVLYALLGFDEDTL